MGPTEVALLCIIIVAYTVVSMRIERWPLTMPMIFVAAGGISHQSGMVDIAAEGRTVLLSSHQIGEVERVADIVAVIHEGQLLLVEPLDKLKRETQQLTITLADGATNLPEIPGQLTSAQHGRQWQVVVRGLDPSQLEAVRSDEAVAAVESRSPTLEEIFVAYMRPNGVPAGRTDDANAGQEAMVP